MTADEIADLPVQNLAADGAHLYLWATNHHLEAAFRVARYWGFEPSTTLVWCKKPRGIGSTGRFTVTTEFVVFASSAATPSKREVERAGTLIREAREAAGLGRAALHHRVKGGRPTGIIYRWENDDFLPTPNDWLRLQEVLPALQGVPRPEPTPPVREVKHVERLDTTWFEWPRGRHSEKPPGFLDVVEQVSPGPYVELFARQPRLGWDHWGYGFEGTISA